MANEPIDYSVVLADMEEKRAALDSAIAGIRQWLSLGGPEESPTPTSGGSVPTRSNRQELPTKIEFDTFFSLSIPEAIKKYLAMQKRPQSVTDITKALETGGLSTTATNLMGTVTATLTRMRRITGEVVPVRRGEWGLVEWYPGRRFDTPEPPKKSKKKPAKQKKADAPKKNAPPTPEQIARIKTLHSEGKKLAEIAHAVGLHHLVVYPIIKKEKAANAA